MTFFSVFKGSAEMQLGIFVSSLVLIFSQLINGEIFLDRNGCGKTKGCFFKPAGCDPQLDCTLGVIFFVSGQNKLTVQMVSQVMTPPPNFQYMAIGFSEDSKMGDDFVSECVLSPGMRDLSEVEVFSSYNNKGKSNDRTYLNETEHSLTYADIMGEAENGLLKCSFVQTIVPQFKLAAKKRLWNLNRGYHILFATGSAQADEINAHDTTSGSLYYPLVSSKPINPSLIGEKLYSLPAAPVESVSTVTTAPVAEAPEQKTPSDNRSPKFKKSETQNAAILPVNNYGLVITGWTLSLALIMFSILN